MSQAGTIGALINIRFTIFNKIRSNLKTQEELAFASFLEVIFETAKESVPSNIAGLSSKTMKSQIDMNEILSLFLKNYTNNYYYLPEHPAAKQFKKKIMEIMRKDDNIIPNQVQSFSVSFNSTLIRKAENSNLESTLTTWKQKQIEDKLFKYLVYLTSLLDEVNPVDDKSVGEYYVENKAVSVEKETWELSADRIYEFKYENWSTEDFINSNKKREFVGAEFGTGKTNFAKKIANDLAIKYLRDDGDAYCRYTFP